jgi:site-specific recombinase XerD
VPNDYEQLPLFERNAQVAEGDSTPTGLGPEVLLQDAYLVYLEALRLSGASVHTIRSFRSDLNLLYKWAGFHKSIGSIATQDLNRFLHWMLNERGKPCSPKTYARRVTTLKNFFGYLYEEGAIPRDPSAALIQRPVSSPLPDVLAEEEVRQVLAATQAMRANAEKPDARPHMLVTLLLQTGIKKGECVALTPADVDRSDPSSPFLWVRYTNPRLRYKERKINLDREWLPVYEEYVLQRRPVETIFDCTARNLEYVLRDVAQAAGVPRKKVSFEALRWTCAVSDFRAQMDHERLRQKLGLSRISWRETSSRLQQLVEGLGE